MTVHETGAPAGTGPPAPTVSALIRTRNRPGYLRESLGSVLAQTLADVEAVVVEDGGDAVAADVAAEAGDPRVRVIRNDSSVGVLDASRQAVAAATGRYVAFLDDDDLWDPSLLETLCGHLDAHPEAVLAFCRRRFVDPDGVELATDDPQVHTTGDGWEAPAGIIAPFRHEALVATVVCAAQSVVLRPEAVDWARMHSGYGSAWDRAVTWLACRDGAAAYHEPAVLASYRIHPGAGTKDSMRNWGGDIALARDLLRDPLLADVHAGIRTDLARLLLERALQMAPGAPRGQRRRDTWESFRLAPRAQSLRALGALALPAPVARATRDAWRAGRRSLRRRLR